MRKFIAATVTAAVAVTAVLSLAATPASAAEDLEAARKICERDGHGYNFLNSGGLNPDGDGSATRPVRTTAWARLTCTGSQRIRNQGSDPP